MFGLFKKDPPTYPSESQWSVLSGKHEGKPMFIRRNDAARSLRGHPEYRFRVGIAVPLKAPDEHGLPNAEEMEQLNAIEDLVSSRLEDGKQSLMVFAITTGGMREFVFYSRNGEAAASTLEALRSEVHTHELQGYVAEDPKWSGYRQFA
jgi:hypothetical protein